MGVSKRRHREARCPLCGAGEARHLVTKRGCEVVRCRDCSLVFVWPQPTPEELDALYSAGNYHAALDEGERRRYFARRLREIEAVLASRRPGEAEPRTTRTRDEDEDEDDRKPTRLLDVGCSMGHLLEVAKASGWEAVGVEVNRNAVEAARARGLDVCLGDLADQAFAEASFDLVTLLDVLEHSRDPRALLAACHRVLRPGGLLVVTTPDIGGLVPRLTWRLFGATIGAWEHPTPPGHLVQFSRRTLRRLLDESGFQVVAERSEHIPVAYSVGKLENSIIDVLAGRHRERPPAGDGGGLSRVTRHASRIRGLPRLGVRALCWAVLGVAGLAARLLRCGDSRWVAACRR